MDRTGKIRTSRILRSFHIFYYSKEVEVRMLIDELTDFFFEYYIDGSEISRKTILRDVQFLKRAGLIQVKYSRKYKAFIPEGKSFVPEDANWGQPDWPENQAQKRFMKKIIRLCTLMTQLVMYEVENPIEWYRERYPKLSERTRQRDFPELGKIEYIIDYKPEDEDGPAKYFYVYPKSAFERI